MKSNVYERLINILVWGFTLSYFVALFLFGRSVFYRIDLTIKREPFIKNDYLLRTIEEDKAINVGDVKDGVVSFDGNKYLVEQGVARYIIVSQKGERSYEQFVKNIEDKMKRTDKDSMIGLYVIVVAMTVLLFGNMFLQRIENKILHKH